MRLCHGFHVGVTKGEKPEIQDAVFSKQTTLEIQDAVFSKRTTLPGWKLVKIYILSHLQPTVDIKSEDLSIYDLRIISRHVKTTMAAQSCQLKLLKQ